MTEGTGFQPRRYHLVVVDDEKAMLAVFRMALEPLGYQLSFFDRAADALEKIRTEAVDLLLTDFHMPEMDGLELIQKCRAENWQGSIVLMSGRLHTVSLPALKELGVNDFLEKPFSPFILKEVLCKVLSRK